jgi:hypothetical protein
MNDIDNITYKKQWILNIKSIFKDENNKKENLMKTLECYVDCDIIDTEEIFMKLLTIIYFKMIYDVLKYDEGEKEFLDTFYSKMLHKIKNR